MVRFSDKSHLMRGNQIARTTGDFKIKYIELVLACWLAVTVLD